MLKIRALNFVLMGKVNASKNGNHTDLTESSPQSKEGFFFFSNLNVYVCSGKRIVLFILKQSFAVQ